ncbi:DNA damage-inducible protein D [Acetobacterium malicum]|uniref:DNA damage-inducible protein D n=1 Tax=Acetobacterium malicum TaxID=52692 RepID=A0ABR6YZU8_9FIRM|nr:DNA damage-inducible protein D [Acetobacterium malicum]MBC3900783.1 DNA damage-inducible protein D [Acetobacterium malicum]
MRSIEDYKEQIFDDIKNVNDYGEEFWYARDLQQVLDYKEWRNFKLVIGKAKIACDNSNNNVLEHFVDVNKMVMIGSNAEREIEDIMLSRYACYLIVQNGDPGKDIIALGQTYFAIKTRQQEMIEDYEQLSEEQKRLSIRNEIIAHNKSLAEAAEKAGVETPLDYGIFQNHGYMGLYGGLNAKAIHKKKELKKSQKILDHMGSTELAANLFRATQTDEKLRRDKIVGKDNANKTHYEVGRKVRETISELGGTMPEDLPTPGKSIKQITREQNQIEISEDSEC